MVNVDSQFYTLFALAPPHIITFLEVLVASYHLNDAIHLLDAVQAAVGIRPGDIRGVGYLRGSSSHQT